MAAFRSSTSRGSGGKSMIRMTVPPGGGSTPLWSKMVSGAPTNGSLMVLQILLLRNPTHASPIIIAGETPSSAMKERPRELTPVTIRLVGFSLFSTMLS
jgi:hypothetical protein